MPRKATGSVRWRNGLAYARVTLGPSRRPGLALPTCRTEGDAEARGALLGQLAEKLRKAGHVDLALDLLKRAATRDGKALEDVCGAVDRLCAGQPVRLVLGGAETFKTFAEKWTKGELHQLYPDHVKLKRSVQDDVERFKNHVFPLAQDVPIEKFDLERAEAIMRALPPTLSPGSRRHVAQLIHRVMALAVYPARLIKANPLPRGFLPSPGPAKALQSLYPTEDAQLLACHEVELPWRVLYGVLAREGLRAGEAENLRWGDLDLERGAIALDENKTDSPRSWALSPGVARTLKAWKKIRKDTGSNDHVFVDEYGRPVQVDKLAGQFRAHLEAAKVNRKALTEKGPNRRPIRAHDLRATFITVALANGKTEAWVMDRTGHTTSAMLNRYRRAARSFAELGQGDMVPLDEALPEFRPATPVEVLGEQPEKGPKRAQIHEPKWRNGRRGGFKSPATSGDASQPVGSDDDTDPPSLRVATSGPSSEGLRPDSIDAVEAALASALEKATAAERWDVVAQVARELEARRLARMAPNVVALDRKGKEGSRR